MGMDNHEKQFAVEKGGDHARRGFQYQDYVAAWWLTMMLVEGSLMRVACELGDDILAVRRTEKGEVHLYIQVKSRDSAKLWTLADIASPDSRSGRSLVEKSIARTKSPEPREYRIVTNCGLSPELAVLAQEIGDRDEAEISTIAQKLEAKLAHANDGTLTDTPSDWLRKVKWLHLGDLGSVRYSSLWQLHRWMASQRVFLGPAAIEEIHSKLLTIAKDLAIGSWAEAPGERSIDRDSLSAHCLRLGRACAQPVTPDAERELRTQLEQSLQRCRDRWIAVGVSVEDATELAAAYDVGENLIAGFAIGDSSVFWVEGEFGLGKSLAADRTFQAALRAYLDGTPSPIPVFLEARTISGSLRDSIECAVDRIGHDPFTHGVFIFLDGLDESGRLNAVKLLQEALRLSKVWPGSKLLMTSTELDYDDNSLPRIKLAGLNPLMAYDVIKFISKREFVPPMAAEMKWGSDLVKPLVAVLIGVAYSRGSTPISIAEAIRFVVEKALTGAFNHTHYREVKDALMDLACRLVDADGNAVQSSEIARPDTIERMMALRFISRSAGKLSFAISLFADWFAAESLRTNLGKLAQLRSEPVRLWLWRNAMAAWLSEQSFSTAADFLDPLVREQPALACELLKLSSRQRPNNGQVEEADWASRWRAAVKAWGEGLGKLAAFLPETDSAASVSGTMHGDMLHVTVDTINGRTDYGFAKDDSPVWIWQAAKLTASALVERLFTDRSLLDPAGKIAKERVWSRICRLTGKSFRRAPSVSISDLEAKISESWLAGGDHLLVRSAILSAKAKGHTELPAPHPQGDVEGPAKQWIDSLWSPQQTAARANSVYMDALHAYASLVETYFPRFRQCLQLYALLPCRLDATLNPHEGDFNSADFRFTALPTGEQSVVSFTVGMTRTENSTEEDWRRREQELKRLRPDSWPWTSVSLSSGYLEIYNEDSVSRLAYSWLEKDLRRVGFLR